MTRFCIYCGAEDSRENPVVNGVCLKCRYKRGELVKVDKKELYLELCKTCYSLKIGFKWIQTNGFEDALNIVVYRVISKIVEPGEGVSSLTLDGYELMTNPSWRTVVKVFFKGLYGGVEFRYPIVFTIFFKPVKCPRCKMMDSGEFEAVLQIRDVDKKELDKVLEKIIMRDKRYVENLIDVIETRNGVDLYFYDHGTARRLARLLVKKLELFYKENYEVVGVRSGVSRARLYISLKPR